MSAVDATAGLSNVHSVHVHRMPHHIKGPHHKENTKIVIELRCINWNNDDDDD